MTKNKSNGSFWLLKEVEDSKILRMFLEMPTFANVVSENGSYYTESEHNKMLNEETILECHKSLLMWTPLRKWADCPNSNFGFEISVNAFSHLIIDSLKVNVPKEFYLFEVNHD